MLSIPHENNISTVQITSACCDIETSYWRSCWPLSTQIPNDEFCTNCKHMGYSPASLVSVVQLPNKSASTVWRYNRESSFNASLLTEEEASLSPPLRPFSLRPGEQRLSYLAQTRQLTVKDTCTDQISGMHA